MNSQEWQIEEEETERRRLALRASAKLLELEPDDSLFCSTRELLREQRSSPLRRRNRHADPLTPWHICSPRMTETSSNVQDLRSSRTEIPLKKTLQSSANLCHLPASNHLLGSPRKSPLLLPLELPKRPLNRPLEFKSKISKTSKIVLSALGLVYQSPKADIPEKKSAREPSAGTFTGEREKEPYHFSRLLEVNEHKHSLPLIHQNLKKRERISNKPFVPQAPDYLKCREQQTLLNFPPPGYLRSPAQKIFLKELHPIERAQKPDKGHDTTSHLPDHGHGMRTCLPPIHQKPTCSTPERTRMAGSTCDLPQLFKSTPEPDCEPTKKRKPKGHSRCKEDALGKTLTTVDTSSAAEQPRISETKRVPPLQLAQPAAGDLREEPEDIFEAKIFQVSTKHPPISGMGAGDCTPEEDSTVCSNVKNKTASTTQTSQTQKTNEEDLDLVYPTALLGVRPSLTSAVDPESTEEGMSLSPPGITVPPPSETSQEPATDEVQTTVISQERQLDQSASGNDIAICGTSDTRHNLQKTEQEATSDSPPWSETEFQTDTQVIPLIASSLLENCVHEPDQTDADNSSEYRSVDVIIPKYRGNERKTCDKGLYRKSSGKGDAAFDNLSGKGTGKSPVLFAPNKLPNMAERTSSFYRSAETSISQKTNVTDPPKKSVSKQVIFPSIVSAAYGAKMSIPAKETPSADEPQTANFHTDQKLRRKHKFVISGMTKIYGGRRDPILTSCSKIVPPVENVASESKTTFMQKRRGNSSVRYQAVVRNFVRKFKLLRYKEASRNSSSAIKISQATENPSKVQLQNFAIPAPTNSGVFKQVDTLSPDHATDTLSKKLKGDEPPESPAAYKYGGSKRVFVNSHCWPGLSQRQTFCYNLNSNQGSVKKSQAFNERGSLLSADKRREPSCTKQCTKIPRLQKNKGRAFSSTPRIPKPVPPEPSNSEICSKPSTDCVQSVADQNKNSHNAGSVDRQSTASERRSRSDIESFTERLPPLAGSDDRQLSRLASSLLAIAPAVRSARSQPAFDEDGRRNHGTTAGLIRRARDKSAKAGNNAKKQLKGADNKKRRSTICVVPSSSCDLRYFPDQSHGSQDTRRSVSNGDSDGCTHRLDVRVSRMETPEGPCGKETDLTVSQSTDNLCAAGQLLPALTGWQLKESPPQSLQLPAIGAQSRDFSAVTRTVSEVLKDGGTLTCPPIAGNELQTFLTTGSAGKSFRRLQTSPGDSERKQSQKTTSGNHVRDSPRGRRVFHKNDNNSAKKWPPRAWRLPPGSVAEFIFLTSHLPGITSLNGPVNRRFPRRSRHSESDK